MDIEIALQEPVDLAWQVKVAKGSSAYSLRFVF